ncbi:MAG: hypothetical protein ACOX27_07055 [Caldicoprobacterales bacterium]|jgi:hypothetical protein|nr:hypothetical protein [Clostridiales bacterium]
MIKIGKLLKRKQIKKGYIIHKTATKFMLCKILNEYENETDAKADLIKLLSHKKTEKELLEDYSRKVSW